MIITIADVSGKEVPAALFMATSKVILKNFALMMKNPDEFGAVMTLANRQICEGNDVNGGHNPPLVLRGGKFEYLSVEQNCVLGMMDDLDYEQPEIQLSKGDILYLYTDGVTEAMDENNRQYGKKRLLKYLNGAECSCDLPKLLEHVKEDLNKHFGAAAGMTLWNASLKTAKLAIVLHGTTEKLDGNKSKAFWLISFCTVA